MESYGSWMKKNENPTINGSGIYLYFQFTISCIRKTTSPKSTTKTAQLTIKRFRVEILAQAIWGNQTEVQNSTCAKAWRLFPLVWQPHGFGLTNVCRTCDYCSRSFLYWKKQYNVAVWIALIWKPSIELKTYHSQWLIPLIRGRRIQTLEKLAIHYF